MAALISVCLPTHNRFESGFLQRAIESILGQSYKDWELIVVDDGSLDGTEQYLKKIACEDSRIQHIRLQERVGLPAYGMAVAFMQSRGEFLAFASDDCQFRRDHLQWLVKPLINSPQVAMSYGKTVMHFSDGTAEFGKQASAQELKIENCIGNSAALLRRSVVTDVGYYDPHVILKRASDWDLWLRVWNKYPTAFVSEVVVDEFGPQLADSLCRSTHYFPELVGRYMETDRSSVLNPVNIARKTGCIADVPFALSAAEEKQFDLLLLEHHLQLGDVQHVAESARKIIGHDVETMRLWKSIPQRTQSEEAEQASLVLFATKYYDRYQNVRSNYFQQLQRLAKLEIEHQQLNEQYHCLQRSASWKLTRPLRELKSAVVEKTFHFSKRPGNAPRGTAE
jgi:glycosyltransferase involved in cell wall biosynthesis